MSTKPTVYGHGDSPVTLAVSPGLNVPVIVDADSGNVELKLPAAGSCAGAFLPIVVTGSSNAVTLTPHGTDTCPGNPLYSFSAPVITPGQQAGNGVWLYSDGASSWYIISSQLDYQAAPVS